MVYRRMERTVEKRKVVAIFEAGRSNCDTDSGSTRKGRYRVQKAS